MDREGRQPHRPGDDHEDDLYEYEEPYQQRPRRRASMPYRPTPAGKPLRRREPRTEPTKQRTARPHRPRNVWLTLLGGCGLGVLLSVIAAAVVVILAVRSINIPGGIPGAPGAAQSFKQEKTQQVQLPLITQMQICNKIGDVRIIVDPNATTTSVTTTTIVRAGNQEEANQKFRRIVIEVQPPDTVQNPLNCIKSQPATVSPITPMPSTTPTTPGIPTGETIGALVVNVTMPKNEVQFPGTHDAVNIAITLPSSALPASGPTPLLDIEAPVGNIEIDGVSGILLIRGSSGDVNVKRAILADGSHIETGHGNITFDGVLGVPTSPEGKARYIIRSEQGIIDVTLPVNTQVTLDANTNIGAINSDFPLNVTNNGGPVNFYGPLNPLPGGERPPAVLTLNVSTGDVNVHKAQS